MKNFLIIRVYVALFVAFGAGNVGVEAACLDRFQTHMQGIFHHGPYQIDGRRRDDGKESRTEVKVIYPDRVSIKSYDIDGNLVFGAIDIGRRAWRTNTSGHWFIFLGEDPYSLKNQIDRGSGQYKLAKNVVCLDATPNEVEDKVEYQYAQPFYQGSGSFLTFIEFDRITNLPTRSVNSWYVPFHSGEIVFTYRFDEYIHIDQPVSDPVP